MNSFDINKDTKLLYKIYYSLFTYMGIKMKVLDNAEQKYGVMSKQTKLLEDDLNEMQQALNLFKKIISDKVGIYGDDEMIISKIEQYIVTDPYYKFVSAAYKTIKEEEFDSPDDLDEENFESFNFDKIKERN